MWRVRGSSLSCCSTDRPERSGRRMSSRIASGSCSRRPCASPRRRVMRHQAAVVQSCARSNRMRAKSASSSITSTRALRRRRGASRSSGKRGSAAARPVRRAAGDRRAQRVPAPARRPAPARGGARPRRAVARQAQGEGAALARACWSTSSVPPSRLARSREIDRPRPVPPKRRLVVPSAWWKASKMRSCWSGAMPMPESRTAKRDRAVGAAASTRQRHLAARR